MVKSKFLRHLSARWFLYLIWAVVALLLSEWIFSLVTAPDDSEKITLFVGAYSCESERLSERLDEARPDYVRELSVEYYDLDHYNFQMFFTVKSPDSDLFILPKSVIDDANLLRFCAFTEERAQETFVGGEFLCYDGLCYGVKIYDGQSGAGGATDYIGYAEADKSDDYYILFNRQSLHAGGLNSSAYDGALALARRLLLL